jgi:hypothetical protein
MTIRKTASGGRVTGVEPMTVEGEVLGPEIEGTPFLDPGTADRIRKEASRPWTEQDERDLARESDDGPSAP